MIPDPYEDYEPIDCEHPDCGEPIEHASAVSIYQGKSYHPGCYLKVTPDDIGVESALLKVDNQAFLRGWNTRGRDRMKDIVDLIARARHNGEMLQPVWTGSRRRKRKRRIFHTDPNCRRVEQAKNPSGPKPRFYLVADAEECSYCAGDWEAAGGDGGFARMLADPDFGPEDVGLSPMRSD